MRRSVKVTIGCALLLGAAAVVWAVFFSNSPNGASSFRLAAVERGPIISAVSTSGTLNAVITVQVGSQVSGQIKELLADFNSEVKAGLVIARIDPETFEAKVRQARAELDVARANVHIQRAGIERAQKELANAAASLNSAKARTEKTRVTLVNAKRNLERRRALFQSGSVSESQIDDAQTAHDQTLAQMNSDEADARASESMVATREVALKTARAQVDYAIEQVRQKEAALYQTEVDLENTFIRSPVDGVVIERAVDIGQTVAATFQAPKLFVIAQDLRQMQVETDVDEADIGRMHVGQEAIFTVDAFAGREFHGQVLQVRKTPRVVQNVVAYTVLVSADNSDLRLLPGMTANIQIIVDERQNALKVPNAALRFKPDGEDAKSPVASRSTAASSGETAQPEERLKQLTAALRLTESQQNQVRVILSEAREKLEALRRQDAPPEEVRRETLAQRERTRNVVATLLSLEQREKYVRFAAAQEGGAPLRGKVYVAAEKDKPQPVDLILGISDGTFTEVVSGDLDTGQQVIIGVNPTSSKRAAKRFAF
ncbi:MAG TPA: HlyD family efflux transporter periplasmic adaptor subunit [Desulfobacterales bacterium]|nr:HlyD family efflux transporter periplasmic adaptor subunit [Desulfobacterales bacterium]